MADFTALKTAIQNAIKQNGNEEITGNLLQEVLLAIVTTLGDGSINDLITALGSEATTRQQADGTLQQNINAEAQARQLGDSTLQGGINSAMQAINAINNAIGNGCVYAGIATPSTTPAAGKVFYLALTAGTYTNFNGLEVSQGINILKNNGSTWSLESFVGIDDAPTPSSQKLVKSGGVLDSIIKDGSAFDLSAYNGGATYADLNAALTALNALPAAYKRGGMSMKFVLSSDNKYLQYRLMTKDWSINTDDWAIADEGVYVENPEYIEVNTDAEDKILEATEKDGTKVFGGNVKILGNMEVSGVSYKVIENPEYLAAWVDVKDKVVFGLKADGKTYIGDADFLNEIKNNQEDIDEIKSYLANFDNLDIDALSSITAIENPEYIEAETDSEGKLLAGRTPDGAAFENVGFSTPKVSIDGHTIENIEDPEGRSEITTDNECKIISYRDRDGVKHEEVGIESAKINTNILNLSSTGLDKLQEDLINNGFKPNEIDNSLKIPKYGTTNIKTEIFYLTAYPGVNSIEDVTLVLDFEDTVDNGVNRMTIYHYYYNNVRLRLYAAKKVKLNTSDNKYYASETIRKVDGTWYYADTLTYDNNNNRNVVKTGYTEEYTGSDIPAEGNYGMVQTEVVQITGPLCLGAWTVEDRDFNNVPGTDIGKTFEHWCIGDIDFGGYFSGDNIAIGMKHQGNSTMNQRKRGYRYTFYKNSTFAKKNKIKIGEMLRLSGYNMKAYAQDPSRIKEPILYRLFRQIWQERPITDRYDWDNKINGLFHGATGTCLGFPVTFNVAGEFYGFYVFLIKKDEKNYMLDGEDESGIFVSGSTNSNFAWGRYLPYSITENYDEEMLDEMSESTIEALENWHHFINGRLYIGSDGNEYNITELTDISGTKYVTDTLVDGQVVPESVSAELIPFDIEHIPDRLDVLGFIDYFINMQIFTMSDNCHNNIIFYSNSEKKKIWPFFYDLDGTILTQYGADADIMNPDVTWCSDMSLWENLLDIYWDSISNRYYELRRTILTIDNIRAIYKDIVSEIPADVYQKEINKWGSTFAKDTFDTFITFLEQRFDYLDNHYFSRGSRIIYN